MHTSVIIGRMQPYHTGHHSLVKEALMFTDRLVIVLGVPNSPRTLKDPFTWTERASIIRAALSPDQNRRIEIVPVWDTNDDISWVEMVKETVRSVSRGTTKFTLIGHNKDSSSYYLTLNWGEWDIIDSPMEFPWGQNVSSTGIRYFLYEPQYRKNIENTDDLMLHWPHCFVNQSHAAKVAEIVKSTPFQEEVIASYDNSQEYRIRRGIGPFVTADAVVTSGYGFTKSILLINRGKMPFKGCLALPGGFLEPDETALNGSLRELREETGLNLTKSNFTGRMIVSDAPGRDPRASIVSIANHFHVPNQIVPKAGDDADHAIWIPLENFNNTMRDKLAFDHYSIITRMLRD